MINNIPVSEIMTKEVVTVDVTADLKSIHHIIMNQNIRHIPVMEKNKVGGIISKTDYLRLTFGTIFEDAEQTNEAIMEIFELKDLMVRNPYTVSSDTSIRVVMEIFISHEFHAVPVVDKGKLVGILSVSDVLRYFSEKLKE